MERPDDERNRASNWKTFRMTIDSRTTARLARALLRYGWSLFPAVGWVWLATAVGAVLGIALVVIDVVSENTQALPGSLVLFVLCCSFLAVPTRMYIGGLKAMRKVYRPGDELRVAVGDREIRMLSTMGELRLAYVKLSSIEVRYGCVFLKRAKDDSLVWVPRQVIPSEQATRIAEHIALVTVGDTDVGPQESR
jgi:hypothetical protein